MGKYGVTSKLVWDGSPIVRLPEEMGKPRTDQLQGQVREILSELAGRVCYDSVGTGRSSPDYHKHVKEVGHLSVYEHAHMTVAIDTPLDLPQALVFLNRPGLWVENRFEDGYRVTFNPRNILDWDVWSEANGVDDFVNDHSELTTGLNLAVHASAAYPMMVSEPAITESTRQRFLKTSRVVEPETDEEKWVSMFMVGSRGFSHELVRHGDRTGVSQRSTRFVQESESEWIDHPLVQEYDKYLAARSGVGDASRWIDRIWSVKNLARKVYNEVVETLQAWLIERGVDKFTARKQARGAARGYLGNALSTELIFSASVGQWKRMLRLRAVGPADAEIRAVFVQALAELKNSRYGADFQHFRLEPSPDGLGEVCVEEKEITC